MTEQELPTELFACRLRFATSVLQCMDEEEEEEDVLPDSLRMGLDRFAAGRGFNRSVIPVDTLAPSGFFTLSGPE